MFMNSIYSECYNVKKKYVDMPLYYVQKKH